MLVSRPFQQVAAIRCLALVHANCGRFGVDPNLFAAPGASAQTLADAASHYSAELPAKTGSPTVGIPLLVHRRCAEPMFNISNAIGYSNLMVQAKKPGSSAIRDILGPSRWIHIEGRGEDKWCREETDEVIRLLRQLKEAGVVPTSTSSLLLLSSRMACDC